MNFFRKKKTTIENLQPANSSNIKIIFNSQNCGGTYLHDFFDYEVLEINLKINDLFFDQEPLLKLKSITESIEIKVPFEGQVKLIHVRLGQLIRIGTPLLEIKKAEEIENFNELAFEFNKKKLHQTSISFLVDDFTNEKTIFFTEVASVKTESIYLFSDNFSFLGITIENNNGFSYLKIKSLSEKFNLAKGDSIIILFNDGSTFNYSFIKPPHGDRKSHSNIIPFSAELLNKIVSLNIIKIKITSERKGIYDVFLFKLSTAYKSVLNQYRNENEAQYLFKYMLALFLKESNERGMIN